MVEKLTVLTTNVANLTNFIHEFICDYIHVKELYLEEPYRFYYSLLFKINNGLDTANLLINNLKIKPHFQDSTFLILRAILSDCIIFDYIVTISKSEDDLKKNIKSLYFDHVHHALLNLSIYGHANKDSQESINLKKAEFKKFMREYYDELGEPMTERLNASITKAVKLLINIKNPEQEKNQVVTAFKYYDIFSKYEHLGDLTFILTHRQFKLDSQNEVFSDIYESIKIISIYLKVLLLKWQKEDSDVIKNFISFQTRIYNLDLYS